MGALGDRAESRRAPRHRRVRQRRRVRPRRPSSNRDGSCESPRAHSPRSSPRPAASLRRPAGPARRSARDDRRRAPRDPSADRRGPAIASTKSTEVRRRHAGVAAVLVDLVGGRLDQRERCAGSSRMAQRRLDHQRVRRTDGKYPAGLACLVPADQVENDLHASLTCSRGATPRPGNRLPCRKGMCKHVWRRNRGRTGDHSAEGQRARRPQAHRAQAPGRLARGCRVERASGETCTGQRSAIAAERRHDGAARSTRPCAAACWRGRATRSSRSPISRRARRCGWPTAGASNASLRRQPAVSASTTRMVRATVMSCAGARPRRHRETDRHDALRTPSRLRGAARQLPQRRHRADRHRGLDRTARMS